MSFLPHRPPKWKDPELAKWWQLRITMAHYPQQQAHLHNFHGRKVGGLLQGERIVLETD